MNLENVEQAGRETAVGRDYRESVASGTSRVNGWIAAKRSRVICGARSGACRDGRRTKGCPSCVTSTLAAPRCTRTERNWTSGGEVTRETCSVLTLLRP